MEVLCVFCSLLQLYSTTSVHDGTSYKHCKQKDTFKLKSLKSMAINQKTTIISPLSSAPTVKCLFYLVIDIRISVKQSEGCQSKIA